MNILSGRYSEIPDEFYVPSVDDLRRQGVINKQGSKGKLDENTSKEIIDDIDLLNDKIYNRYKMYLNSGLTREQSRGILPYSVYTVMYWKIDLKNLLHFLDLRCDSHAQKEIQDYANAILELISPIIPYTISAWEDYSPYRGAILLTKYEVDA